MTGRVMTVLGPVNVESLGILDAHNHVWIDPPQGVAPGAPVLREFEAIAAELGDFRASGGAAQVDCQPAGCGRDGRRLRALSEVSGVHIVAITGAHLPRYYPPEAPIWQMNAEEAQEYFVREIQHGLEETREAEPVFPGLIKIAAQENLKSSPLELFEAAAQASRTTSIAIAIHSERGQAVEDILRFMVSAGADPARLIFCHVDKRPDIGLHRELASEGVLLEYDTFCRPKYHPKENLWPLIEALLRDGFSSRVALASDLADGSQWQRSGGGPGIARFASEIPARLASMEVDPEAMSALIGGNMAHRLAM